MVYDGSVTDCLHKYKTPMALTESIRSAMKNELGLTVSIGVSFNKIFAKLGSDMKKPDAITEITPENYREKIWPLPASDLLYVGHATTAKLKGMGIRTIGELAAAPPEILKLRFGINGVKLWRYAAGMDDSRVLHKDYVTPIKSIGHGITCVTDLINEEEVWKVLPELSQDVGHRLRAQGLAARGVQIDVRGNDLYGSQYQRRLPFKTQLPCEIAEYGFRLFEERYDWRNKVRALCIRAIDLVPQDDCEQLSIFIDQEKRDRRVRIQDTIGGFDQFAAASVWDMKTKYPDITSVLVLPYLDRKMNADHYDYTTYPPLEEVPRRFAISKRNEWLVDKSDVVIAYVTHDWGGAAVTLDYARRKKKAVLNYADAEARYSN